MSYRKENILIVDDDIHILELVQRHLQAMDYHTYKAVSVKEAVSILRDAPVDLLVTDLRMPGVDGFELIQYASEHYPDMPILVVTGYISTENAWNIGKSGVVDYLIKPFTKEELRAAVSKSLENIKGDKGREEKGKGQDELAYGELIGKSEGLEKVKDIIGRVRDNRATILIQGESGTGKELVARAIHYSGKFSREPFVAVNCGAIPESLLESELFGYEKGAFTGAGENRLGFFQAAHQGTIFLDEIGDASFQVQNGLLRVLQEKEVTRVGARKAQKIEVRVIAATNSNLKELVRQKKFREDLYYRLTVVEIDVPPLRKRKSDIPLLVEKYLQKYGVEYKDRLLAVAPDAMDVLLRYDWPGNIRELENIIQRAVIMCDTRVELKDIPENLKYNIDFPQDVFVPLAQMEKEYIRRVLRAVDDNKTKASEILGIDRKTLRSKLQ
ncbi:DNA-binding transcriptional response regulator, NtrC family, contains REC, AAA-type ATPase, and a Fis-type DNA-binding domains [Sinomicrobium oceani]|uniref:DNA-binding transcriptional response regulator, NtrC family, contains REC, AAA-type ATPase, and a Fis-type DNA-binding domains n=1 Tax=Sinomicrobium oceani TaxID=1150368 RepID=A0A1K1RYF0_9FLAO|nr:sigma-54 dependent transcriptional regulator [Sinomicrobium oceani]SFW76831.1 DNA-binding transcriptional response regulator, NtrC family, contains REC, AAA-type ATPase, and a Fis-type DNA-binding domains [Sinomicrobium oceani]